MNTNKALVYIKQGILRTMGHKDMFKNQGQLKTAVGRTSDNYIVIKDRNISHNQKHWYFYKEDLICVKGDLTTLPLRD